MKKLLFLFLGIALVISSCTTTTKFKSMQVSPITPMLNISSDQYVILGEVTGTGEGTSYEEAKETALGAAITAYPDADALILPKYEIEKVQTSIIIASSVKYKVTVKATAIKLKK